jgi:DNA-damage-inducible protein J
MNGTSVKKLDTVKVNHKLKTEAEIVLNELGLTTDAAINVFFKQIIKTNGIPFKITNPPKTQATKEYEKYVDAKLKEAEDEIAAGILPIDGKKAFEELRRELEVRYAK